MAITLGVGTPRFYAGVTVNGMDLAGYTYEEGLAALQQAVSSQLDSTYTLSYAGRSWAFVPSRDVDAFIDVETQAQRAWNIGHTGSVFSRQQQVLQLRENPIKIDSSLVYDAAKLEAFIAQIQSEIDTEPVDAMVMLDVDGPKVYGESSTGLALDAEALRQTLVARMESGGALDVALPVEIVEPGVSSESAAGGLQKIVEVRTDATVSSSARLSNIKLDHAKINLYIRGAWAAVLPTTRWWARARRPRALRRPPPIRALPSPKKWAAASARCPARCTKRRCWRACRSTSGIRIR